MSKLIHILITGAYGQLGSEFKALSKNHNHLSFIFTDIDSLNITSEKEPNPSGFWMKNLIEQGTQLNQSQEIRVHIHYL